MGDRDDTATVLEPDSDRSPTLINRLLERVDPRHVVLVIESTFVSNSILVYPCEPSLLQRAVGNGLDVDVVDGQAHLAVAFVDQRRFRPRGVPARWGRNVYMVEYLAFVTYRTSDGRLLKGLKLLQSDTTSWLAWTGSRLFTRYRFRKIDLTVTQTDCARAFSSRRAAIDVAIGLEDLRRSTRGWESDWPNFDELASPRSFNFQQLRRSGSMLIVRGVLKHWSPRPVAVMRADVGFVNQLDITGPDLPVALEVEDVEYVWRNGRIDR